MDERVLRFRVGVVVVAAAIITIILVTLLGAWPSPFRPRYTVKIQFPTAPGVTVDTPVRKSGIQIGRVSDVKLQPDGNVQLTVKIDAKYQLGENEICRITTGSLVTGDAVLEWVRSETETGIPGKYIQDGDYLTNGEVAADPFKLIARFEDQAESALVSVESAGLSISGAGQEVEKVAQGINSVLEAKQPELESMVDETLLALQNFNGVMSDLEEITGDEKLKHRLQDTIQQFPELFANAEKTLSEVQNTLGQFNAVAARAERNLTNLEDFTGPLGDRGEQISQDLVDSMRNVNNLLGNLAKLSDDLNSNKGTIGQLISDPELYERLNRTVATIEELVRKLEPILNDARVISDKIARDPERMGVKGLLDRRPLGTGQKYPTSLPQTPSQSRRRH
ncbi:MAG: MlaD family protein [Planctomycetota bacterium]